MKPLSAIDNNGLLYQTFLMVDKVTYKYDLERKVNVFFSVYFKECCNSTLKNVHVIAEESLSYAFRNCPSYCARNKRLILIYLVPVKMFLGHMPSLDLLKRYQLQQFAVVVESVK